MAPLFTFLAGFQAAGTQATLPRGAVGADRVEYQSLDHRGRAPELLVRTIHPFSSIMGTPLSYRWSRETQGAVDADRVESQSLDHRGRAPELLVRTIHPFSSIMGTPLSYRWSRETQGAVDADRVESQSLDHRGRAPELLVRTIHPFSSIMGTPLSYRWSKKLRERLMLIGNPSHWITGRAPDYYSAQFIHSVQLWAPRYRIDGVEKLRERLMLIG
ncbi:hypothetical protein J6590_038123 [Homalodisca vitripennis]|nr:hypothetical protein J6590_038123 [Homalodisca vitripennis]